MLIGSSTYSGLLVPKTAKRAHPESSDAFTVTFQKVCIITNTKANKNVHKII
jgi:hypothetical protein